MKVKKISARLLVFFCCSKCIWVFSDFTFDELSHLAAKAMLPEKLVLDTAKQTVEGFYEIWAKEKAHLPLTKDMIDAIDKHLRDVPLR